MPSSDRPRPTRHFTYANVTSTLSLFLVIAGGAAIAASVPRDTVKSKSIKDNVVRSKDLRDGAAVGGVDVIDDSLNGADIAEGTFSTAPSGPAGGSLAGTYPSPGLDENSVDGGNVVTGSINSTDISDNSLIGADIVDTSLSGADVADGGLTGADLADGSVAGADLTDESVTAADIGTDAIGSSEIDDFSLKAADVGSDALHIFHNYPAIAGGTCNTDLQPNPPRDNSLTDSVVVFTPSTQFTGPFAVMTEIQSATVFAVKLCNLDPVTAQDPDGPDGGQYNYVVIDFTPAP